MILILWMMIQSSASAVELKTSHACESSEQWKIELPQKSNWVKRFNVFLTKQESPLLAFSEALQLKKIANLMKNGEFEAEFSEYWVARVFYDLEFYPLAHTFFTSTLENSHYPELKKAALGCLNEIYLKMPDWNSHLKNPAALNSTENKDILISHLFHQKKITSTALPEAYADLINGIASVKDRDHSGTVHYLKRFQEWVQTHRDPLLDQHRESASLFLARALYSVGRFKEAIEIFQKMDKRSNLQINSMNDLAWSYLLSDRPAEALGIALQLRSGALKSVFAPESVMIAAMVLNETCAYPDAARMIQAFVQDYSKPFEWLITTHTGLNPYQEVLSGLKGTSLVPAKIRSEWMKSEAFLARQAEINQLIKNTKKISGMPMKVSAFQQDLAMKNVEVLKKLIHDLKIMNLKSSVEPELAQRLLSAKKEIRRFIRFNQSSKILLVATQKYGKTIPKEREKLVNSINRDLSEKNKQMLTLLKHVRENVDLIEIEVYNGASRELARTVAAAKENKKAPAFETALAWNWGRFPASEIEQTEVWEDELGTLKADITNRCQ